MEDYALNIDERYAVAGCAELSEDMAYIGHMINDGAILNTLGGADALPKYLSATNERRNAGHQTIAGCHMVTTAVRDIAAGEELFVTYGAKYWQESKVRRRNEGFSRILSTFL